MFDVLLSPREMPDVWWQGLCESIAAMRGSLTSTRLNEMLSDAGVPAQKVTKKQQTGIFRVEFYHPNMQRAIESSDHWEQVVTDLFDGVDVVGHADQVAYWRDGQPTIMASLDLEIDQISRKETPMEPQNAIVPINVDNAIAVVNSIKALSARLLQDQVFVEGHDYGIIPGTSDKKVLLLPGMEKYTRMLNCVPDSQLTYVERDYDKGVFHYEYEVTLRDVETNLPVPGGRGVGMCTSMETAFRWRWVGEFDLPPGLDPSLLRKRKNTIWEFEFAIQKAETSGQYGKPAEYWQQFQTAMQNGEAVKTSRKTRSGKSFPAWEITSVEYQVPNPDIANQVNTIMKRAKKRALGDAVKGAANVSEMFTVDLEDFIEVHQPTVDDPNVIDGEIIDDSAPQSTDKPSSSPSADNWSKSHKSQITKQINMYERLKHIKGTVHTLMKPPDSMNWENWSDVATHMTWDEAKARLKVLGTSPDYAHLSDTSTADSKDDTPTISDEVVNQIIDEACTMLYMQESEFKEWLGQDLSAFDTEEAARKAIVAYVREQNTPLAVSTISIVTGGDGDDGERTWGEFSPGFGILMSLDDPENFIAKTLSEDWQNNNGALMWSGSKQGKEFSLNPPLKATWEPPKSPLSKTLKVTDLRVLS